MSAQSSGIVGDQHGEKEDFYFDSVAQKWVSVKDFAFDDVENHFAKSNPSSKMDAAKTALLSTTTEDDGLESSFGLVDSTQLQEDPFSVKSDDEREMEKMFRRLQIEQQQQSRDGLQRQEQSLPQSSLTTPKVSPRQTETLSQRFRRKSCVPVVTNKKSSSRASSAEAPATNLADELSSAMAAEGGRRFIKNPVSSASKKGHQRYGSGRRSHHAQQTISSQLKANSKSDGSLDKIGATSSCSRAVHHGAAITSFRRKKAEEYKSIKSKVRDYIEEVKGLGQTPSQQNLPLMEDRRARSLSSLAVVETSRRGGKLPKSNLARMKALLSSTSNLGELKVTLSRSQPQLNSSNEKLDRSKLFR